MRDLSVSFRFGEEVAAVERHQTAALCVLKSGKKIAADTVMYPAGRQGQTDDLALEAAGLLVVSPDDGKLLGVHVFGAAATETVHTGQAVIGCSAGSTGSRTRAERAA